jgi:PncC family amidohydrolase
MVGHSDPLARDIADLLLAHDATLAVAETTAGGLISARLIAIPGASRWFERGVVAYSAAAKHDLSTSAERILREHGAVSTEFVTDMVEALRARSGATFVVGESGIAGPQTGRRSAKPVGSAVIAVASPHGTHIEEHVFPGERTDVMAAICERALTLLKETLDSGA